VLFGFMTWLITRKPAPGTVMGVFVLYYGVARGLCDFLRVNDNTVLGLTGAQWMCIALIPTGIWVLTRVRKVTAAEVADLDAENAVTEAESQPEISS
jgi:prolipoprotein diacylglyceryltransferase